jgi:hypothetical protein
MDTTAATPLPLPFDALPFDDGSDAPIGFSLTPRARRSVVPEQLPALRLVVVDGAPMHAPGPAGPIENAPTSVVAVPDDPGDVRPAQARALRRSGMPVATIAAALGIDPDLVERWTQGATPTRRRASGRTSSPRRVPLAAPVVEQADAALGTSTHGAAAVGMAVALADIDPDGSSVSFSHGRVEVLASILSELRRRGTVRDHHVRVAIRASERLGVDRCRAQVAHLLAVPVETVLAGRWIDAPEVDAIEVVLRITDAAAVATVAAWIGGDMVPSQAGIATA